MGSSPDNLNILCIEHCSQVSLHEFSHAQLLGGCALPGSASSALSCRQQCCAGEPQSRSKPHTRLPGIDCLRVCRQPGNAGRFSEYCNTGLSSQNSLCRSGVLVLFV